MLLLPYACLCISVSIVEYIISPFWLYVNTHYDYICFDYVIYKLIDYFKLLWYYIKYKRYINDEKK